MQDTTVLQIARIALSTGLLVSTPALLVITVVGLGIAILQAVVQVQEQSVGFVLKLLATMLTLALCGPWMLHRLVSLVTMTLENLGDYAR